MASTDPCPKCVCHCLAVVGPRCVVVAQPGWSGGGGTPASRAERYELIIFLCTSMLGAVASLCAPRYMHACAIGCACYPAATVAKLANSPSYHRPRPFPILHHTPPHPISSTHARTLISMQYSTCVACSGWDGSPSPVHTPVTPPHFSPCPAIHLPQSPRAWAGSCWSSPTACPTGVMTMMTCPRRATSGAPGKSAAVAPTAAVPSVRAATRYLHLIALLLDGHSRVGDMCRALPSARMAYYPPWLTSSMKQWCFC
jgi:hypothetical protein